MFLKRKLLAFVISAVIITSVALFILPRLFAKNGIEISIVYFSEDHSGLANLQSSEAIIYYQVFIISYDDGLTEIAKGKVSSSKIFIGLNEKLRRVCERWLELPYGKNTLIGIEVNVWILNKAGNEILGPVIRYKLLDPEKILNGGIEKVLININEESIPRTKIDKIMNNIGSEGGLLRHVESLDWLLEYEITPEDIAAKLEENGLNDWVKWVGGKAYIKTPILVIENKKNSLGYGVHITAAYDIAINEETTIEGSYGIGNKILEKISEGLNLSELSLKLYNGVKTVSRKISSGIYFIDVLPGRTAYIYIWTRPYFEHYRWYVNGIRTDKEKFISYISDFLMEDSTKVLIESSYRPLPSTVLSSISNSTEIITYKDSLDVGESIDSWQIINYTYDIARVGDYDIGTLACAVISSVVSYLNPALGIIASTLTISLSYNTEATTMALFGVQNRGDGSSIDGTPDPNCVNSSVVLHYYVTTLQYRKELLFKETCYFRIPIARIITEYLSSSN